MQSVGMETRKGWMIPLKPVSICLINYIIINETINIKLQLPLPAHLPGPSSLARSYLPLSKFPPSPCDAALVKWNIDAVRRRANRINLPYTSEQPPARWSREGALWLLPPTESSQAGRNPGWVDCSLNLGSMWCCHVESFLLPKEIYNILNFLHINSQYTSALPLYPKALHVCFLGNAVNMCIFTKLRDCVFSTTPPQPSLKQGS